MTKEPNRRFNDRQALEEGSLADAAHDTLQAIPHAQLAKLHTKRVAAERDRLPGVVALCVTAAEGNVTIVGTAGDVSTLTPNAAALTADLLLTVARDAGRQKSTK